MGVHASPYLCSFSLFFCCWSYFTCTEDRRHNAILQSLRIKGLPPEDDISMASGDGQLDQGAGDDQLEVESGMNILYIRMRA